MDETLETVPLAPPPPTALPVQPAAQPRPANSALIWILRGVIVLLLAVMAVFAWQQGVRLRHWVWDTTVPIRYTGDVDRDYQWGRISAKEGWLNQYEKMQNQAPDAAGRLDHPPLRLAVLTLWGHWSLEHFPKVEKWSSNHSYALTAPLMRFDLLMEAIGLIAAFFLTRAWVARDFCSDGTGEAGGAGLLIRTWFRAAFAVVLIIFNPLVFRLWELHLDWSLWIIPVLLLAASALVDTNTFRWFFRGCIPASVAVLLLWFNPAVILSAYGWPAWDLWLIPVFLVAALLATYEWWFTAGIIVGIGTMLDPHMVLAIPLFLLWNIILHGWPKWPFPSVPTRWIVIPVVLIVAAIDWFLASNEFLGWTRFLFRLIALLGIEALVVVTPLILCHLFSRPLPALRFLSGLVIAVALIVSPWLLSFIPMDKLDAARAVQGTFGAPENVPLGVFKFARTVDVPAVLWVLGVLASAVGLPWVAWLTLEKPAITGADPDPGARPVPRWRHLLASNRAWRGIAAFGVIALVVWPWMLKRNHPDWLVGVIAIAALIAAIQLIHPRGIAFLAVGAVGTALLLCIPLFHGSAAWYDCGFQFDSAHLTQMTVGPNPGMTDNLPAVLVRDFDWHRFSLNEVAFTIPTHFLLKHPATAINVSIGTALQWLFGVTLLLCSLGAGMHGRMRSSRMLVPLTAIWLMYFCFPPQLHERYLLFAAGISCICAGTSAGLTLLGLFLSLAAGEMMLDDMLATAPVDQLTQFSKGLAEQFPKYFSARSGEHLLTALNPANPDLGYAIVLCGLIFLYFSIAPRLKNRGDRNS